MSRRRSVAFIPVAVGALLGGLGAFSVSAAPPTGTDASEVTHWNQVAATTLIAFPPAGRGCATCIPDQHGHGAGRRVRRSQRDRAEEASPYLLENAYGCEGVGRRRRRNGGVRRALKSRLDRHPTSAVPGSRGTPDDARHAVRQHRSVRSPTTPSRCRASQVGHAAAKAMLDSRVGDGRFGPSQWDQSTGVGKLAAAHQSDDGAADPRSDPMGGRREAVPHPKLVAVPQRATARARAARSGRLEFNEVKGLGRATGSTRDDTTARADVQGQVVAERARSELERSRPAAHRTERPRRRRRRETPRAAEHECGGRGDQWLERQVPLRLLAAVERDHHDAGRWERRHHDGPDVDCAHHRAVSRVGLGAPLPRRRDTSPCCASSSAMRQAASRSRARS